MSDDYDDDDAWDPVIDVIEEKKLIEISIDTVTKEELLQIKENAIKALVGKLTKLNVVLKNLDVYCHNNILLVNDRYGICKEFAEIAGSFGFSVKSVECGLSGKSYIIHDSLVELIKVLDAGFNIETFSNRTPINELQAVLERQSANQTVSAELQAILRKIISEGHYSVVGTQRVVTTYEDGRLIDRTKGEIVSEKEKVTKQLQEYMRATHEKLSKANSDLQNGTVKLLFHRARQMGYSVKEERKGTQVQLVLVRAE